MTTFTWSIKQMSVMPVLDGKTDVVVSAQWNILGQNQSAEFNLQGWQNFVLEQGEGFTPYNQLTQEQVVGWVKNTMGEIQVNRMELIVKNSLNEILNPPVRPITPPLPWAVA